MKPIMRSPFSPRGRSVAPGYRHVLRHLAAYIGSAIASCRPRIRSVAAGADPHAASRDAALYVSFDRWGLVADFVVAQVAALAEAGRRVTFITNSPRLAPEAAARLLPYVREVVHRRNFGHDFGAYKDGIARLELHALDSLVLMNDSCYGPFGSLAEVDRKAALSGRDIFGITESWDVCYHLQTYYLWIGPAVLRSLAFTRFWRALLPSQPRSLVILDGEIGFTQAMLKAGFSVRALCPYGEAALHAQAAARQTLVAEPSDLLEEERAYLRRLVHAITAGDTLNPTHSFWDVLVTQCGAPFIKRELLRANPVRIPGLLGWERVVASLPGSDLDAIRSHLQLG